MNVLVSGRVQGVWFRESTRLAAQERGVVGWVRNTAEGEVEAVFEGAPAAVASMVSWARIGPERAVVTSLQETAEKPEGLIGFDVRPTA